MIMRRNLVAVFTLALLSPFVAEFLLGDQYLSADRGVGAQLGMFVVLGLWYGSGAVLIREVTRRTGRGWPTILLLGLAFGLIEEGLLTQSLFNPHYLGLDLISYGHVGGLGIGLPWTVFVLTLHVVWSIATPIALVEGLWPGREPWGGRVAVGVTGGLLLLGAQAIAGVSWASSGFLAAPGQLIGSAVLAVAIVIVALRRPLVDQPQQPRPVLPAAAVGLVLASTFQLIQHAGPTALPAGVTTAILLLLLVTAALAAHRWRLDVLGLAAGAVLTYAWVGMTNAVNAGSAGLIEQLVIIALALLVTLLAVRRRRSALRSNEPDADGAGHAATHRARRARAERSPRPPAAHPGS